jgi:hypothetical protein
MRQESDSFWGVCNSPADLRLEALVLRGNDALEFSSASLKRDRKETELISSQMNEIMLVVKNNST